MKMNYLGTAFLAHESQKPPKTALNMQLQEFDYKTLQNKFTCCYWKIENLDFYQDCSWN